MKQKCNSSSMASTKAKPEPKKQRKSAWKWKLYSGVEIFLWIVFIGSMISELFMDNSITGLLRTRCSCINGAAQALERMINYAAVRKSAETIGICSILITKVYASLDKTEFGLLYSRLLETIHKNYHYFVLGHFSAILLCLWMTGISKLEGASLALVIVLWGCILQWNTLYHLCLSSKSRRVIAVNTWKEELSSEQTDDSKIRMDKIFSMVDGISLVEGGYPEEFLEYLAEILKEYTADICMKAPGQKILNISEIWRRLLHQRATSERTILACEILRRVSRNTLPGQKYSLSAVCAGYILGLYYGHLETDAEKEHSSPKQTMELISNEIASLERHNVYDGKETVNRYCCISFTALICMLYITKEIDSLKHLFLEWKPEKSGANDEEGIDKDVFTAVITAAFPKEDINRTRQIYDNLFD